MMDFVTTPVIFTERKLKCLQIARKICMALFIFSTNNQIGIFNTKKSVNAFHLHTRLAHYVSGVVKSVVFHARRCEITLDA
jgi:hypothetical protein